MMPNAKPALTFIVKSIVFTAIFWAVWYTLQSWALHSSSSAETSQAAAYDAQLARVNRQLDAVEAQQKRMDAYLNAQEENTARFDKVLQVWEKQAGIQK